MEKSKLIKASIVVVGASIAALAVPEILAGTNGNEFGNLKNTFQGWVQGYAGQAVAIASIGLGALVSLSKQTPFPILGGIGVAVLEQYTPAIVGGIMTFPI